MTRTIVSTDDDEIAQIARAHGADVPFLRPPELAEDESPMMPVLAHAVRSVEQEEDNNYTSVLLLDPTSPGRLPEDIDRASALLEQDPDADAVVACSRPTFNPFWVGVVERKGYLESAFPGEERYTRRQDVPAFLRINGALYLYRRPVVDLPARELGRRVPLEIPEARAFAIDDEWEFETAQALLERGLLHLPWLPS